MLASLLAIPREARDADWRKAFHAEAADAPVAPAEPPVARGPDGFPYLVVERPEPHRDAEPVPLRSLVGHATDEGLGIVLDPRGEDAGWVFSYGSLLCFRMSGHFEIPDLEPGEAGPRHEEERVLIAAPSEAFLPGYARRVMRRALEAVGVDEPGVLLLHQPGEAVPAIVLSLYADQFEGPETFQSLLSALTWYLPHHYRLLALRRSTGMERHFEPL
jgi:hypothetical protein